MHSVAAGSGFHLPSPAHTALILPAGTNSGFIPEEYLSSLQCVLICLNGTISRDSGITTVDWREKVMSNKGSKCSEKEGIHLGIQLKLYPEHLKKCMQ